MFTRLAADKAGATKMDRPRTSRPTRKTGKVYVALTNNDERGAPGKAPPMRPIPRNDNKSGQILEITDDHAGTDFTWELLLVCGDPAAADTYFAGFDKTKVSPISCPDNVAFDSHGNLWISTDGNALDSNDGLFAVALDGPNRGETKQFLTVPLGAETCGPVITDDLVTVCVQHPGEHDDNSVDNPLSRWPEGGNGTARPSVVAVWKTDGQISACSQIGNDGRRDLPHSHRRATAAAAFPPVQPHPRRRPPLRGHRRRRRLQLGPLLPALRRPRRPALRVLDDARRVGRADVAPRDRRAGRPATPTAIRNCSPTWRAPSTTSPTAG